MSTHTQRPNVHQVGPDEPADTQMMGIMHSALRRDMVRVRLLLGTRGVPSLPIGAEREWV